MAGLSFSDDYKEMLRLLRRARKAAGLTQVEVARIFDITQGTISKMELGEVRIDPIELQRFAELYGVEITELLPPRER